MPWVEVTLEHVKEMAKKDEAYRRALEHAEKLGVPCEFTTNTMEVKVQPLVDDVQLAGFAYIIRELTVAFGALASKKHQHPSLSIGSIYLSKELFPLWEQMKGDMFGPGALAKIAIIEGPRGEIAFRGAPPHDHVSLIHRYRTEPIVQYQVEFTCGCIWTAPAKPIDDQSVELRHGPGIVWLRQGHFKEVSREAGCPVHGKPVSDRSHVDEARRELERYT